MKIPICSNMNLIVSENCKLNIKILTDNEKCLMRYKHEYKKVEEISFPSTKVGVFKQGNDVIFVEVE